MAVSPILWNLFTETIRKESDFVGGSAVFFGVPAVAAVITYAQTDEKSTKKRLKQSFTNAFLASLMFFVLVFPFKAYTVCQSFSNTQPITRISVSDDLISTQDLEFDRLNEMVTRVPSGGTPPDFLAGFTNERVDEMTQKVLKEFKTVDFQWGYLNATMLSDFHDHDNTAGADQEQLIKSKDASLRLFANSQKGRIGEDVNVAPALLQEIYQRLSADQRDTLREHFQIGKQLLAKLHGDYTYADLHRATDALTEFEYFLKQQMKP
jgi:hypothetical protein